jgi:hypothetical protein
MLLHTPLKLPIDLWALVLVGGPIVSKFGTNKLTSFFYQTVYFSTLLFSSIYIVSCALDYAKVRRFVFDTGCPKTSATEIRATELYYALSRGSRVKYIVLELNERV